MFRAPYIRNLIVKISYLILKSLTDHANPDSVNKLNDRKIRWIVNHRRQGDSVNSIAIAMRVSSSRIRQVISYYRKNGEVPRLSNAGRRPMPITDQEKEAVLNSYRENPVSAVIMELILRRKGIVISHNRIHSILRILEMSRAQPQKGKRKKWVKYERDHSNSLWHTDWYEISDRRWYKRYLIAYIDDSSRFVTGYGIFDSPSTSNTILVLEDAINTYGRPEEILTDHGSQFFTNSGPRRKGGESAFQEYLRSRGIRHILGRIDHPQTNGKIERFFAMFQAKISHFSTVEEFVQWYNFKRPHMSLDLENLETPYHAFLERAKGIEGR